MLSLEEAIKHAEEVAEFKHKTADGFHTDEGIYLREETKYRESAEEHRQLAEWLKNYKRLLKSIKSSVMNYADIIGEDLAHQIIFDIMDDIEENY